MANVINTIDDQIASMQNLEDSNKELNGVIGDLIDTINDDMDLREKAMQKQNSTGIIGMIKAKAENIKLNLEIANILRSITDDYIKYGNNKASLIERYLIVDDTKQDGVDRGLKQLDKLTDWIDKAATYDDKIKNTSKLFSSITGTLKEIGNMGKTVVQIGVGLGVVFGSMAILSLIPPTTIVTGITLMGGVLAFMYGATKIDQEKLSGFGGQLMDISKGVLMLTGAIGLMALIGVNNVMTGVMGINLITGAIALSNKLLGGRNNVRGGSNGISYGIAVASASIGVLGLSIWLFNSVVKRSDDIATPVLAILGLGLGLAVIDKIGSGNTIKSAIALGIASASVGLLGLALSLWTGIGADTVAKATLFTGGLIAGIMILGTAKSSLLGAGSLLVGGLAIMTIGMGISSFSNVSTDTLINAGIFIGGFALTLGLLGSVGATSILGAGALIAGGFGIMMIGKGLQAFDSIDIDDLPSISASIGAMAVMFSVIGNPFTLPFTLLGAGAVVSIGLGLIAVTNSLVKVKKNNISKSDVNQISQNLDLFINSIVETTANVSDRFMEVRRGIFALSGIGNMIGDITDGLVKMGRLEMVEHTVKDGKVVAKSVRKFTKKDFQNIGVGIGMLIDGLTEPLAVIGRQSKGGFFGFFKDNAVEDGIESISGLGSLISNIANGIVTMGSLQFNEYDVRNGKLVIVKTRKYKNKDFANVSNNIGRVINSMTPLLEAIGLKKDYYVDSEGKRHNVTRMWGSNNPITLGIEAISGIGGAISSIADIVAGIGNLQFKRYAVGSDGKMKLIGVDSYKPSDFTNVGANLSNMIRPITNFLSEIGSKTGFWGGSDVEDGIDALSGLGDVISPITDLVNIVNDGKFDTKYTASFGSSISNIIGSVNDAMGRITGFSDEEKIENFGAFTEHISDLASNHEDLENSSKAITKLTKSLAKMDNSMFSSKRLDDARTLAKTLERLSSKELYERIEQLVLTLTNGVMTLVDLGNKNTNTQPQPQFVPVVQNQIHQNSSTVNKQINQLRPILDGMKEGNSMYLESNKNILDTLESLLDIVTVLNAKIQPKI